jgi:hypothetical protein
MTDLMIFLDVDDDHVDRANGPIVRTSGDI